MKITDVRTVLLTGPCTADRFLLEARRLRSAAFVEVHTGAGVVGVGETYAGYFCPELVPHVIEFWKPILVGVAVEGSGGAAEAKAWIDQLWRRMYLCENFWCRVGLGAIVLTGVEAALWDLQGKLRGKPVCELLGGPKHARLACYATGGPSNYPKAKLAEKIDYYLGLGFRGFKLGAGKVENGEFTLGGASHAERVDFEADKLAFVRQHVGPDIHVLIDGHMGNSSAGVWPFETARAVAKALESYNLFLFEEPLPYYDAQGYADLAACTRLPIAGGECLSTMPEWREYLRRDSFDIAQPDASYVGGLSVFLDIAAAFAQRGKRIATHAWGAGGSLMQNVHAGFAAENTAILEVPPAAGPLHTRLYGDSFRMKDGYVHPPQTPGLGIELTEAIKREFPFVPGSGEFVSVPGKVLST